MASKDGGRDYGEFKVSKEFFESDPIAKEIRNIVARIVRSYAKYVPKGQDIGLILDEDRRMVEAGLKQAFYDLEEFDVKEDMHQGKDLKFFANPRNLAEYVGGQILGLRHSKAITDLEFNRELEEASKEEKATLEDDHKVIPDPIRRLSNQAGAIWTAQEMLAIPDIDESEET
jgi:hypothetical protein